MEKIDISASERFFIKVLSLELFFFPPQMKTLKFVCAVSKP
jgi:hypothetical protein